MRTIAAVTAGLCLALAACPALGEPKPGGQLTLEQYFAVPPAKKKTAKRRVAQRKPRLETGSVAEAATAEASVPCKKFSSLIAQTITVPCR